MPSAQTILKITFICMLIACVILGITGIVTGRYGLLALLPFAIFGTVTAFVYGSSGTPSGSLNPLGTGGTIKLDYPWWVWLIDVVLLVGGFAVAVATWQ